MGNSKQVLPVLQWLEVVIAFVSSVSSLFVCLSASVCPQDYSKSCGPMFMKLVGWTNRLDFGNDLMTWIQYQFFHFYNMESQLWLNVHEFLEGWDPLPKFGLGEVKHFKLRTEMELYHLTDTSPQKGHVQCFWYYHKRGEVRCFNFFSTKFLILIFELRLRYAL